MSTPSIPVVTGPKNTTHLPYAADTPALLRWQREVLSGDEKKCRQVLARSLHQEFKQVLNTAFTPSRLSRAKTFAKQTLNRLPYFSKQTSNTMPTIPPSLEKTFLETTQTIGEAGDVIYSQMNEASESERKERFDCEQWMRAIDRQAEQVYLSLLDEGQVFDLSTMKDKGAAKISELEAEKVKNFGPVPPISERLPLGPFEALLLKREALWRERAIIVRQAHLIPSETLQNRLDEIREEMIPLLKSISDEAWSEKILSQVLKNRLIYEVKMKGQVVACLIGTAHEGFPKNDPEFHKVIKACQCLFLEADFQSFISKVRPKAILSQPSLIDLDLQVMANEEHIPVRGLESFKESLLLKDSMRSVLSINPEKFELSTLTCFTQNRRYCIPLFEQTREAEVLTQEYYQSGDETVLSNLTRESRRAVMEFFFSERNRKWLTRPATDHSQPGLLELFRKRAEMPKTQHPRPVCVAVGVGHLVVPAQCWGLIAKLREHGFEVTRSPTPDVSSWGQDDDMTGLNLNRAGVIHSTMQFFRDACIAHLSPEVWLKAELES